AALRQPLHKTLPRRRTDTVYIICDDSFHVPKIRKVESRDNRRLVAAIRIESGQVYLDDDDTVVATACKLACRLALPRRSIFSEAKDTIKPRAKPNLFGQFFGIGKVSSL
ncbi:MAG: hypothetical protein K2I66_06280, partial [Bacteroidales bacterium]|nr:hypothetical protein [Bacteroidales bacterium]